MRAVPEALDILSRVRLEMQMGHSVPYSLEAVTREPQGPLSKELRIWLKKLQAGQNPELITKNLPALTKSSGRRSLVAVFERGMKGSPIDDSLEKLEEEFLSQAEITFEKALQTLPLKLLVPLTLFILPGVILLLIAPLIFGVI